MSRTYPGLPARPPQRISLVVFALGITAFAVAWRLDLAHFDSRTAISDLAEYGGRYRHLDTRQIGHFLIEMAKTVAIAIWGTFLGLVGGLGLCGFAARTLAPSPIVYRFFRGLFAFLRAVPDLLFAILFVMALGAGPQAGVMALGLHGIGFLGKTLAESLEQTDIRPFDGVGAVGASRFQLFTMVGVPSIAQEIAGYGLYTLDRNVRTAVLLGIVGAGGIGLPLKDAIDRFDFPESATILLVILGVILLIESASDALRKSVN